MEAVRRAGRLCVTLHWLKALAEPGHRVPAADGMRKVDRANTAVQDLLHTTTPLLMAALDRSDKAEAATKLFRALPDLVPPGEVYGKRLTREEQAAFHAGYEEQHALWAEELGQVSVNLGGTA